MRIEAVVVNASPLISLFRSGLAVNGDAIPTQSGDAEKAGMVFAASEPGQGRAQPGEANP